MQLTDLGDFDLLALQWTWLSICWCVFFTSVAGELYLEAQPKVGLAMSYFTGSIWSEIFFLTFLCDIILSLI